MSTCRAIIAFGCLRRKGDVVPPLPAETLICFCSSAAGANAPESRKPDSQSAKRRQDAESVIILTWRNPEIRPAQWVSSVVSMPDEVDFTMQNCASRRAVSAGPPFQAVTEGTVRQQPSWVSAQVSFAGRRDVTFRPIRYNTLYGMGIT
jgi:hypothetical protein